MNRRRMGGTWVAIVAAYLIAVQTVLVGLTLGASATPMQPPGSILCFTGGARHADDGSSQDRTHLPNCCVLGCSMFGPSTAPPSQTSVLRDRTFAEARHASLAGYAFVGAAPFRGPQNPRAPPTI